MSCTGVCVAKVYLLVFDVLFMLTGIVVLVVGAITVESVTDLHGAYDDISFFYLPYILLAIGVLVIVLGIIGFIAAYKEIPTLLLVFFASLVVIFGMEIILGVLGLVYSTQLEDEVTKELKESLRSYKEKPIMDTWDRLQSDLLCCAVDGYTDWANITNSEFSKGQAPDSCCEQYELDCGQKMGVTFHAEGCKEKIMSSLEDNIFILGAAVVACGIFQIVGMIATMILYYSLRSKGVYV